MPKWIIEPTAPQHADWICRVLEKSWGGAEIAVKGTLIDASKLPGFVAREGKELVGLITYDIRNKECQIVTLNAVKQWAGIGSGLLEAVEKLARERGCPRIWLVTTNDNLDALRFYQRREYRVCAVYSNVLEVSRKLKPQIPMVGEFGIPLRDEIELEKFVR